MQSNLSISERLQYKLPIGIDIPSCLFLVLHKIKKGCRRVRTPMKMAQ